MPTPLVTIITPTFNPRVYFGRTVESVLSQTLTDWEWIVVDDGSTQPVPDVAKRDARIGVVRQRNGGQATARNLAIDRSRGDYLAFVDDDDVWSPSKLEKQIEALKAIPRAAFCHTQFQRVDAEEQPLGVGFGNGSQQTTYVELLTGCGICASTVVARREAVVRVGGFNPLVNSSEDYDLWLKMARDTRERAPFVGLSEPLALYRIHAGSTSSRYATLHRASTQILHQHLSLALANGEEEAVRAARQGLKNINRNYGGQAWAAFLNARQKGDGGKEHLLYALRYAPTLTAEQLVYKLRGAGQGSGDKDSPSRGK